MSELLHYHRASEGNLGKNIHVVRSCRPSYHLGGRAWLPVLCRHFYSLACLTWALPQGSVFLVLAAPVGLRQLRCLGQGYLTRFSLSFSKFSKFFHSAPILHNVSPSGTYLVYLRPCSFACAGPALCYVLCFSFL